MVTITFDEMKYEVNGDQTVLEAAREVGVSIPTLCYHPDLTSYGGCRLCNVEVTGARFPLSACTLPVSDGMVVNTATPKLLKDRKKILELILSNYYDGDKSYDQHGVNELLALAEQFKIDVEKVVRKEPRYTVDSDHTPFIWVDLNKCILCKRCIRACAEIQGRFVWELSGRGMKNQITPGSGVTLLEARCESCGACVAYCPTGALDHKPSVKLGKPDKVVTTTCAYCGVGCNFDLHIKNNQIIRVVSNPNAPVNGMSLCVKGRFGYDYIHHTDRLSKPLVREYILEGKIKPGKKADSKWVEVDWDTAMQLVTNRLYQVKKDFGADAIGVLTSAKCTNEENYLMNKFSRQVIGTHNVDHCARLCHSSTVSGLAMCYGSGAMTNTIADICSNAQAIFIIGSNTTEQHPVIGNKIRQAVIRRGVKLIVADPRKIDITEFAVLHLRQRPGTDVALVNGLMHIILKNNWQDQAYIDNRCENFPEFAEVIQRYTPEFVSNITGVPEADLLEAASIMAENHPMAVFWAMGITQHTTGVLNVLGLGNLQMLLGNVGIPGGGINPLRGQNNVQGACDMGGLPNYFPGYQLVTDALARSKFQDAWSLLSSNGDKPALFNEKPGLAVTEMVPLAGEGKVKALYILGENPAMSDPNTRHTQDCLEACEFVLLQEIFSSETAPYADVLLPGSTFAEKDGTFTNTERRIQLVRQAIPPVGESRTDWEIITDLSKRLLSLQNLTPVGKQAAWDYQHPRDIMDEIAAVTPIYSGVSYDRLEQGVNLHWPVRGTDHPGTPILHIGQFTRGKGKFHATEHLDPQELPDKEYPFVLTTGRVIYHWHGAEMTRRSKGLLEVYPEALVEINPEDALDLGINGRNMIRVTSRRGVMVAKAVVTDRVSPGLIFGNFHFPGAQNVNNLTIAALDPTAKIPEYKVCAVKLELV
jgi:formate dehydrogenase alpha subunit